MSMPGATASAPNLVLPTPRRPVSTIERLGTPTGHPFEHHVERVELLVATGRARPGRWPARWA